MDVFGKIVDSFTGGINRVTRASYRVAVGLLAVMMFLTTVNVAGRYLFNRPVKGSIELTEFMVATVVAIGLAYCWIERGHISVDVIVSRFPPRVQGIIERITLFISLVVFSLITWRAAVFTKVRFDARIVTHVLAIPTFPFVGIVAAGCALLTLVILTEFLNSLRRRQ